MKNIMYSIKYGYAVIIVKILDWIAVAFSAVSVFASIPMIKLSAKYGIKTMFGGAMSAMRSDGDIYRQASNEMYTSELLDNINDIENNDD